MEVIRSYKFRIYPDIKRQSEIDNMLVLAQRLYNKLLEKSIQSYKNGNSKISMSQFNEFEKETDTNISVNILRIATIGQSRSNIQGDSVRLQKEAGIKELRTGKTYPLHNAVNT